jgi:hypothetical protein
MTSHDLTVAVYSVIAVAGAGLQIRSQSDRSRIPSLGKVFSRAMHTRSGRIGILAGWAWLGLHFFAR